MIYLLVSLIIYWSYYFFCLKTIGEKNSMSATFKDYPWLFRLFIFGTATPIIIYALDYSIPLYWAGWFIFSICVAAGRKGKIIESWNHSIGATGGILIAYAGLIYNMIANKVWYQTSDFYTVILFLISAYIILPVGKKEGVKHHTTWIEHSALTFILLNEILKWCI